MAFILIGVTSCLESQYEQDIKLIESYIADHQLDTNEIEVDDYGVYYIELLEGTGFYPEYTDSVVFNFKQKLANNVEVSSIEDGSFGLYIDDLIVVGLRNGLLKMKTGGSAVILVPSYMAYGSYSVGDIIPSNSVLIYYVDLLQIIKSN